MYNDTINISLESAQHLTGHSFIRERGAFCFNYFKHFIQIVHDYNRKYFYEIVNVANESQNSNTTPNTSTWENTSLKK